jgi:integrase
MSSEKDLISDPVKVDGKGRRVAANQKAHRWILDIPASVTGTRRQRRYFKARAEAVEAKKHLQESFGSLSASQRSKLAERGMTVEDAVEYALRHSPIIRNITMRDLFDQYVTNRTSEVNVTKRYLATLESYRVRICGRFGDEPIHSITKEMVRDFLCGLRSRDGKSAASISTRNHYLETFRAVFRFAKEERLLAQVPTDGIKRAKLDERRRADVLSLNQVEKLLGALLAPAHSEVAPAALLQLFAGVRRSELPHIKWDHINGTYLRLDDVKRCTKPRPVEIPEALIEYLARYRRDSGYVFLPEGISPIEAKGGKSEKPDTRAIEDAYTVRLQNAAIEADLQLSKNVLRHTAITMRLNLRNDLAETARWAGNSPSIVTTNYEGRGTPDDAKQFYALRPKPSEKMGPPANHICLEHPKELIALAG